MGGVNPPRRTAMRMTLRLAGVSLAAALTLSACSTLSPDEAAIIDGQSISESELQTATAELNSISPEPAAPATILSELTRTPFLDAAFDGTPAELTDQQLNELLAENGLENPSDLTLDVARTRQYLTILQDPNVAGDPQMAKVLAGLQDIGPADFEAMQTDISPRYGTFDPETASVIADTPEWITPAG